jgi:hypothetical protein
LDTEGRIKIGYPVSGVVFKLLLEPIIPSYATGIFFSATFSIKNGVSVQPDLILKKINDKWFSFFLFLTVISKTHRSL